MHSVLICARVQLKFPGHMNKVVHFSLKSGVEARDYAAIGKKEHLRPIELELRRMEVWSYLSSLEIVVVVGVT